MTVEAFWGNESGFVKSSFNAAAETINPYLSVQGEGWAYVETTCYVFANCLLVLKLFARIHVLLVCFFFTLA